MEVNKTFDIRVRCTNKQLLDYIESALTYGSEIIPGLEFVSFVEPVSLFEETPIAQTISVNPISDNDIDLDTPCTITTSAGKKSKYYNGEWVDMSNKSAVQDMFDCLII